jgi:uncharacterized protein (DUF3820 family)
MSKHMTFGRYTGEPIESLPSRYLCWVVTTPLVRANLDLVSACADEIVRRASDGSLKTGLID